MKVKFFTVKSKSERTSIYIRFWDSNRIDLKTKTGLTVNQSDWNQKRQEVKNNITATDRDFNNTKLRELRNFVLEKYNIDYNSNNSINENWLKNKVNEFFDRKDESEFFKVYFSDWIQKFIDEVNDRNSKGSKFTSVRIQRFKVVQNKFKIFEENTNKKFKFSDLTYFLILAHCYILFIGGHYTYAEVPLFDWIKDTFEQNRNNYDKVGHFAQGFVPAMIVRELFVRKEIVKQYSRLLHQRFFELQLLWLFLWHLQWLN